MSRLGSTRSFAVAVLVAMLATVSGCPTAADKPGEPERQPTVSDSRTVETPESSKPSKPPADEFQQPPALPPGEPLPKAAVDEAPLPPPAEAKVVEPVEPTSEETTAKPSERTNPLRATDPSTPAALPAQTATAKPSESASEEPQESAPPAGRPMTAKNSGAPFDPIKENGKIFEGWSKPKAALVITGMEEGYLEPCGCAGLERMKGGMTRRATMFKELREKGWPVLGLDVGGLVQGFGRQAELKYQTAVEGKRKMGYDAIAFGTDDLRLPAGELLAAAAGADGKPVPPFISANVGLLSAPGETTLQSHVFTVGGIKIGVTSVIGKQYQKEINNAEIELLDPDAALAKIVPELKQKSDYLVLLAHATLAESVELAKKFPDFNVVVTSDGNPEPPDRAQVAKGTKTLIITVGYKGQNAIVLGLFDDPKEPFRYQRVPLDSRFVQSPEMKLLMAGYQEQLKAIGFAGLGLRPVPHPLAETNGRFIGSKQCATCHEKSYSIWKKSGHARAYDTLVKLNPPRDSDPECISCHVTGWHPTKFFPYVSGYESREKTPQLIDAGCEGCHGPGEKHAAAESGGKAADQEKFRKAMIVTKAESKKQQCYSCHDLDNSPDFDFDKYWPFVEHKEKE